MPHQGTHPTPLPKNFWGVFRFSRKSFFSFRAFWRAHILQWRHLFSTLSWPHQRPFQRCIAFRGFRNRFRVINPQIDPLWVIFAEFDNLAPPGELVCVCRASVLPPDDSASQKCKISGWGTTQFWGNLDQSSKFAPHLRGIWGPPYLGNGWEFVHEIWHTYAPVDDKSPRVT